MKERLPNDPAGKNALMELAKHANLMFGTNNLKSAAADADKLQVMLDAFLPPSRNETALNAQAERTAREPISANTGAVAYAKSRLAWVSVRRMLQSEVDKLRDEILAHLIHSMAGIRW